jgi:NADH-quinone oxidoreductase subunit L
MYLAAFLTAFYAFRIGFRVSTGDPCPEARELEQGHLAHAEPENPATGEREDTDVGFPGPEHHIAERELPMKVAMSVLAFLALFGGLVQVPGVDAVIEHFLEGSFEDSALFAIVPSTADAWIGLGTGALISIAGIALAYYCYVLRPGVTVRWAQRFRPIHTFLINKWYFDELFDALVYRPVIATGRFANAVVERVVVDGLIGATTGVVRGFGAMVRGAQSGFIRAYALLLVTGFAALGLYFLVSAS